MLLLFLFCLYSNSYHPSIIQEVKAIEPTVYIRADGTIDPSSAPITTIDGITYTFTGDLDANLVIERDNVVINGADHQLGSINRRTLTISGRDNVVLENFIFGFLDEENPNGVLIDIVQSSNVNIRNSIFGPIYTGDESVSIDCITIDHSSNVIIRDNLFYSIIGENCIKLISSSNNQICDNRFGERFLGWFYGSPIILVSSSNNVICNNSLKGTNGPSLYYSDDNMIFDNYMLSGYGWGITLYQSNYNNITGNILISGWSDAPAIAFLYSNDNIIIRNEMSGELPVYIYRGSTRNTFIGNNMYVYIEEATGNIFYHNNLAVRIEPEVDPPQNIWDNGYPSGGNYWGVSFADSYSGPYQNITGSDGIQDTPIYLTPHNVDHYPLTEPMVPLTQSAHIQLLAIITVEKVVNLGLESIYMNDLPFNFEGDFGPFQLSDGDKRSFTVGVGDYYFCEEDVGWTTEIKLYIDGVFQSVTAARGIQVRAVDPGKTYTLVFVNKPPDFIIPETPWGVIGALLMMLAAVVLFKNRTEVRLE